MSTVTFDVTFSARDILRDPQIRKALREREDTYLDNLAWLDEDLSEKRHQENINWLDQDLAEKRHQENIAWLDQDLNNKIDDAAATTIQKYARKMIADNTAFIQPKIWHCGNGNLKGGAKQQLGNYHSGLAEDYAWICHGTEQDEWTQSKGFNAHKQFKKFNSVAKEGDILFLHCSHPSIKGMTHYGIFTGETEETNHPGISHICVYEWIPLPEVVDGSGGRQTLYEVTPTTQKGVPTKNYQNYSIP